MRFPAAFLHGCVCFVVAATRAQGVGDEAPPLSIREWRNGAPIDLRSGAEPRVVVLVFASVHSGPSRAALATAAELHERLRGRSAAIVAIFPEAATEIETGPAEASPAFPFRLAADEAGATRRAYCTPVGVGYVPYAFVLGPDRRVAWHGHPLAPELERAVNELLDGTWSLAEARRLIAEFRTPEQLETMFQAACKYEDWAAALQVLNALLDTDAPKQPLLRYKLTILIGELHQPEDAARLAEAILQRYADDAEFLNTVAWDLARDERMFARAPELAVHFARAAFDASAGNDAAVCDTYARVLYRLGALDRALRMQERAVELSTGPQRVIHHRMLDYYRRCRALLEAIPSGGAAP